MKYRAKEDIVIFPEKPETTTVKAGWISDVVREPDKDRLERGPSVCFEVPDSDCNQWLCVRLNGPKGHLLEEIEA